MCEETSPCRGLPADAESDVADLPPECSLTTYPAPSTIIMRPTLALRAAQSSLLRLRNGSGGDTSLIPGPHSQHRLALWQEAYISQLNSAMTPRVAKIDVDYIGRLGSKVKMRMTRGISSPVDCLAHMSQWILRQSVIALVNGQPWDMHRPLQADCSLDFVHFKDHHNDPEMANAAFWRSSAFLLGRLLETAFQPQHQVRLIQLPLTQPASGSFLADIQFTNLDAGDQPWVPSAGDLQALSRLGQKLACGSGGNDQESAGDNECDLRPLLVNRDSELGRSFTSSLSQSNDEVGTGRLAVYRTGNYVQACSHGPLIRSTDLIGRFSVTSFRPMGWLKNQIDESASSTAQHQAIVYRVQGIALPTCFCTHFTTFNELIASARMDNTDASELPPYVQPF